MWLTLYAIFLCWMWLHSLLHTRFHLFVMASVLYALHYFLCVYNVSDPRAWPWFRGWRLWDRLHRTHLGGVVWAEGRNWSEYESKGPRIFLVSPTDWDLLAIVLTFGLHGQEPKAVRNVSPLLVLPDHLFRYPVLANVLQWVGGVPFDKARLERAIKEDGSSLVVVLPRPQANDVEQNVETGVDSEAQHLCEWFCTLSSNNTQPLRIVPVFYHGTDGFYVHPVPFLSLGLMGTCIPRAVHLRVGVARALTLVRETDGGDGPHADVHTETSESFLYSATQMLDSVHKDHHYFANLMGKEYAV